MGGPNVRNILPSLMEFCFINPIPVLQWFRQSTFFNHSVSQSPSIILSVNPPPLHSMAPPAATPWQPYADYRATLTGDSLSLLTDAFDGVFCMKDGQLSLLRNHIEDLKKNPAR